MARNPGLIGRTPGYHPSIPHRWEFSIGILDGNHAGSTPVI
jgi:hypothetical protein